MQRFRNIEEGLNDKQHRLHVVRLDSTRPPDVKRQQVADLETGIEDLKTARRDWEAEVRATLLPALPRMKPEPPIGERTPPLGLPALPRLKPDLPAEEEIPPTPRTRPTPPIGERTPPAPRLRPTLPAGDTQPPALVPPNIGEAPEKQDFGGNTVKGRALTPAPDIKPPRDGSAGMPAVPLTADGAVDEDALRPGQVYRIPESAGGGLGRWTNGMFFNFDRKADWNIRSVVDLNAFSGASDEPTPEERLEAAVDDIGDVVGDLDDALLPAARLGDTAIEDFENESKHELTRAEGGFTLTDPAGNDLFDLAEEDAAELARIWTPEIAGRVTTMGVLWREDLSPAEKRKLLAEAIGAVGLSTASRPIRGRRRPAGDPAKLLNRRRLKAYDALAAAMERGATDEEIGALIEDFQAAMLPEVFGTERFVRELLMDVVPGLGNARSVRHLQNDIADVERAIETGEWGSAAMASGMAVLDAIGIFPGFNIVKEGVRGTARGIARATAKTIAGRMVARLRLARYLRNADKTLASKSVEQYFGKVWKDLTPEMQEFLRSRKSFFVGRAGELKTIDEARRAGFEVLDRFGSRKFDLPKGATGRQSRIFDFVTKEEWDTVLGDFFVVPGKGSSKLPTGLDSKVARGADKTAQTAGDKALANAGEIQGAEYLHLPANAIKPDRLAESIAEWVNREWRSKLSHPGGIPRKEIDALIKALQKRGDLNVGQLIGLTLGHALARAAATGGEVAGNAGSLDDASMAP